MEDRSEQDAVGLFSGHWKVSQNRLLVLLLNENREGDGIKRVCRSC
jgi:hypothetical protein